MKCKNCGNECSVGLFCPECGFKNEEESAVQEPDTSGVSNIDNKTSNVNETPNQKGKGLAMASLIMGIISILTIGAFVIPEILGIIFALVSKKDSEMSGLAKAGMICSIISIIVFVLIIMFM